MSQSSTTGRASEPTPAQLKELFSQIEAGRVTKERLQDFLRGQTPAFPSYAVTVDYSQTIEQLVQAGHYDQTNGAITSAHFPSRESGRSQLEVFLLNFDHISSEDIASQMAQLIQMANQGLHLAIIKELLAFGAAYPDLQREKPIVGFGSRWWYAGGYHLVPYLSGNYSHRNLALYSLESVWNTGWRFAVVRK